MEREDREKESSMHLYLQTKRNKNSLNIKGNTILGSVVRSIVILGIAALQLGVRLAVCFLLNPAQCQSVGTAQATGESNKLLVAGLLFMYVVFRSGMESALFFS